MHDRMTNGDGQKWATGHAIARTRPLSRPIAPFEPSWTIVTGFHRELPGCQQQQLRNVYACIGAFNVTLWMYSLVEVWAWNADEDDLVDRSASPWDSEPRRASHADKRKALRREMMQREIEAVLVGRPSKADFRALADRLLEMAA